MKSPTSEARVDRRAGGLPVNDTPRFGDPKGPWISTFAWRPRFTYDSGTIWLRRCWKRHIHKHQFLDGGADWWWQYRRFPPA